MAKKATKSKAKASQPKKAAPRKAKKIVDRPPPSYLTSVIRKPFRPD